MKYVKCYIALIGVFMVSGASGCDKDDCNDNPTFVNMEADVVGDAGNATIALSWTGGEALPLAYFADVTLLRGEIDLYGDAWQNDHEYVQAVNAVDSQRIDIVLTEAIRSRLDQPFVLHLQFGDRSDFIDCSHPGAPDGYYLDVEILLDGSGPALRVADFSWEELFVPGPR